MLKELQINKELSLRMSKVGLKNPKGLFETSENNLSQSRGLTISSQNNRKFKFER